LLEVWTAAVTDAPTGLEAWLTPAERVRAEAIVDHAARQRFVLGRVLLVAVLAYRLDCDRSTVKIVRHCPVCTGDDHGRPAAPGSGLAVSVSHAGRYAAVAVTDRSMIGIDLERYPTRDVVDEVSATVLSEDEGRRLAGRADPGAGFARLWTRKEAAAKCTGIGLLADLRALDVRGPQVDVPTPAGDRARISLRDLPAPPAYALAVAFPGKPDEVTVGLREATPLLRRYAG
jgi:4'-phosphopantetheinyl transferase